MYPINKDKLELLEKNSECPNCNNWLLNNIFKNSPSGLALLRGPNFIFERINHHWHSLVSDRKYLGQKFSEVYPETLPKFLQHLKNTYETGNTFSQNGRMTRIETKLGEFTDKYYNYCYTRILDNNNNPYGILCNAIDVTDIINSQKQLEKSESDLIFSQDRIKAAVSVSALGFYEYNILKNEVVFSEQMQKDWRLGPKSEFPVAMSRIHPEDREKVTFLINEAITKNQIYYAEYRLLHTDNSITWIEAQGKVSYNQQGKPISFLGTSFNISDKKKAQLDLEEAKSNADRANQAKSTFLAHMSHEIRTPLAAISGFSDLLQKALIQKSGNETEYLTIIRKNTNHLLQIVEDILDLSKIEAEKINIEKIKFSLKYFIEDFLSLTRLKAQEKGIEFNLKINGNLPVDIISDSTRLRQILSNITGNAIKFTDSGQVTLIISLTNDILTLTVEDSGIGISPSEQRKLFNAFVQADSSTTRKFGGTGLGLVLTKKLCEVLSGSFKLIKSIPGEGSTFQAEILTQRPEDTEYFSQVDIKYHPKLKDGSFSHNYNFSKLNILIVEDSPENQKLLQLMMESTRANVTLSENGLDGVNKALNNAFDIVLMDIEMPILDGHQATKILRDKGYSKPIIAISAHVTKEEMIASKKSGFSNFLPKPIDQKKLFELINNYQINSINP